MPNRDCDLLIIGAGCAGLSIAREISRQSGGNNSKRVLLIEPRENYSNDRTWCFWQRTAEVDRNLVSNSWKAWQFDSKGETAIHRSASDWAYHCVPSANFYERAQQDIDSTPSISLLQGLSVTEVNPNGRCIEVETSAGRINTYQVIDTRPPTHARCNEAPIKQVFYGLELRLNEPLQDPEIVRLMSQMSTDARGFKFQYLLPLSSDRVLLEVTRFSAASLPLATLKNEVYEAVKTTFPAGIGEIIRHEQGVIPMGLPLAGGTGDPRWVRAGTSAGAVRASSGYAFQRIQRWAKNGAAAFLKQHPVSQQTPITGTLAWMDSIFLETLRRNADLAPDLFMALARNVPADRLVRFLTDQPRVADLAAVIAALPARPMLKTLSKSRFATPKFLAGKTIE